MFVCCWGELWGECLTFGASRMKANIQLRMYVWRGCSACSEVHIFGVGSPISARIPDRRTQDKGP